MEPSQKALGKHLQPRLDEARLARQHEQIVRRTAEFRPRTFSTRLFGGAAACAVVAGLVLVLRHDAVVSPLAGPVESQASSETLVMPDGSRAVLEPQSHITLATVRPDLVEMSLDRGGVDFEVVHREQRRFVVTAGGYDVIDKGTRFTVRLVANAGKTSLEVKVLDGRVQVARHGNPSDSKQLGGGETWSATVDDAARAPLPAAATPASASADTEPTAVPPELGVPAASAAISMPKHAPLPPQEDPKELLSRAEAARATGRPREAAAALDALRTRHRKDPRAALAAYELGRLRLETLGDPSGAAEALGDAIAISPAAPFREDAEGRRVQALERMGDEERCVAAKTAYLTRYPQGIHRAEVLRRCGTP